MAHAKKWKDMRARVCTSSWGTAIDDGPTFHDGSSPGCRQSLLPEGFHEQRRWHFVHVSAGEIVARENLADDARGPRRKAFSG
jgi:hypothetical protein